MAAKWSSLGEKHPISYIGLEETLLGGQSFSWTQSAKNQWIGVIGQAVVQLKWNDGFVDWLSSNINLVGKKELLEYLWLDSSYDEAVSSLPWRSDSVLKSAMDQFAGLRILRQPMDETLFVFLLSSAKSIPQIKVLREKTYQLLGENLGNGLYAFPGWKRLKDLSEKTARDLGMGYRAKYVTGVAEFLKNRTGWLESLTELNYSEAKKKLQELPGVGPKVADCVLLFGGKKNQAFPIDTWILQSLESQYGMNGWKINQMQDFARIHFGAHAGLAQQFLFSFQRKKA
ncbi:MAG: DNA glycosylase [Opitutales bacterium]|jgi:N-glycosylase/DNA lyase